MTPERLAGLMAKGVQPIILDVRSDREFRSGHIPGATHAPLPSTSVAKDVISNKEDLVILVCEHGPRAQMARFFLKLQGYKSLELLDGHMFRWRNAGHPLQLG